LRSILLREASKRTDLELMLLINMRQPPFIKVWGASNYQVEVGGKPVTYVTVRVPVMAAIQIMSAPYYWLLSSLANTSQ